MRQSHLTKAELIEFAQLSQKKKSSYIGIKLSDQELNRYKSLADKHGVGVSTFLRQQLLSNTYHFVGVKHEKN